MRLLFSRPASHPPRRRHRRRSRAGAAERPRLGAAPPRRTSPSPRLASSSGRPVSLVAVGGAEHAGSRHMATGPDLSSSSSFAAAPDAVSLVAVGALEATLEEDGVLRSQITIHGTDNWTIIAAQFRDKTARQCRRRWYNYLNSECKKGGWSQEEDMLLCEAQKVLGNRWTEIAKVVSGRTDNAVKNRFSTLCKRRAKDEDSYPENSTPCSNANAKRVLTQIGCLTPGAAESSLPVKQISSDLKENIVLNMRLFGQEKSTQDARRCLGRPHARLRCPGTARVSPALFLHFGGLGVVLVGFSAHVDR